MPPISSNIARWSAAALLLVTVSGELRAQQRSPARASLAATSATSRIKVRGTIEGSDVVRAAKRYLGVPYRWGGTTPRGFDCSGFVRHVFAEYGIGLPRTAREQAAIGEAPFPGDLQAGDLLFFYGSRDGSGAQHIAIYVGGDTIIHASSTSRRVKLDVMTGSGAERSYFQQRLIAVRRLLPLEGVLMLPVSGGDAVAQGDLAREMTTAPFVY